jgi:GrpB-like predicted nucleotidyltransferase (UPF0157 family)
MSVRKAVVCDYDPAWKVSFETEKSLLKDVLRGVVLNIEHIGSTAVPGLAAKPIVDILMEVAGFSELDNLTAEMAAIGYKAKGENGIRGRRYFQKGGILRTHHLHVFQNGDPNLERHIAFRDFLRNHDEVVRMYEILKRDLASRFENEKEKYQDGKSEFVSKYQKIALDWYNDEKEITNET